MAMFFNPLVFPTLLLGASLYAAGYRIAGGDLSPSLRRRLLAGSLILCLPGLSFLLYYLHLVREPAWYVEFRSWPFVESASALWGFLFGLVARDRPFAGKWLKLRLSMLLVFVPFAKPVLLPLGRAPFNDAWEEGVCLQSTMATCGPCSLATVMTALGVPEKERDVARAAFSALTGTENWYLIRHARRRGLRAEVGDRAVLADISPPAILGVRLPGGAGHFITYLADERGRRVFGDPLSGRLLLTDEQFSKTYDFTGWAIAFARQ
ncbi:MAG: peptidase C39 bacteriocin processing [Elusimicrobia bacterium]|nr:MAG: peptidase C39 bacteriocin processing [Elusimicrobiota bacterium]